jgi:hypothetical protein
MQGLVAVTARKIQEAGGEVVVETAQTMAARFDRQRKFEALRDRFIHGYDGVNAARAAKAKVLEELQAIVVQLGVRRYPYRIVIPWAGIQLGWWLRRRPWHRTHAVVLFHLINRLFVCHAGPEIFLYDRVRKRVRLKQLLSFGVDEAMQSFRDQVVFKRNLI